VTRSFGRPSPPSLTPPGAQRVKRAGCFLFLLLQFYSPRGTPNRSTLSLGYSRLSSLPFLVSLVHFFLYLFGVVTRTARGHPTPHMPTPPRTLLTAPPPAHVHRLHLPSQPSLRQPIRSNRNVSQPRHGASQHCRYLWQLVFVAENSDCGHT